MTVSETSNAEERKRARRHMVRSTSQHRTEWALAMRSEMQGQQLPVERELPKELPPELNRGHKEHDPYYDVVGTC